MQAVILAGGLGTRLLPVVSDRPKPMALINGKPFLEYQISLMKNHGVSEIVICIGYMGDVIEKHFGDGSDFGVNIIYSYEEELLGTAGAIKNAENYLDETFIAVNGDTYVEFDAMAIYNYHKKQRADLTIGLVSAAGSDEKGMVKVDNQFRILDFVEKPINPPQVVFVNSGVYVFDKNVLNCIPSGEKVSLEYNLFPTLIADDKNIYGYEITGKVVDIGTPSGYRELQRLL